VVATEIQRLQRPRRGATLLLFDGEHAEELGGLDDVPSRLGQSRLLWLDTNELSEDLVDRLASALGLDEGAARGMLVDGGGRGLHDGGEFVRVTLRVPANASAGQAADVERVTCVVGAHWIVTAHERPVEALDELAELAGGSGPTGELSGPSFLATLFEWVLNAYSASFEEIEEELEEIDERGMRGDGSTETQIDALVELRRRAGRLRRELSAHRPALLALTQPELEALGDEQDADRFRGLLDQYETALQTARDARSGIVSSFDVLIARTGHRTNEIMKVLTLASVILLPGSLLAGVLGMNFKVPLFQYTFLFWVVIAVIVAIAAVTVTAAKLRDWI
jgi:magnesium transporter